MIELTTAIPYPADYDTVLDQSRKEQGKQERPALTTRIPDMAKYDIVILGYPNWWSSIPMPIATFLESYSLSGKKILPFCSHGGGQLGQSVSAIAKLAPDSDVAEGLAVSYSGGKNLEGDIDIWLEKNNSPCE